RPQHPGPVEFPRWRGKAIGHLRQTRDIRKVPEVLRMIQAVSDQEQRWRIETNELCFQLQLFSHMFVQQRANLETLRTPPLQQRDQLVQRLARVDDVLDEQDVLPLQLRLRIIHQPDVAARYGALAVARGDNEVDLQGAVDLSNEIAEKNEAALQQAQHQQFTVRIGGGDLLAQLIHPLGDRLLVK